MASRAEEADLFNGMSWPAQMAKKASIIAEQIVVRGIAADKVDAFLEELADTLPRKAGQSEERYQAARNSLWFDLLLAYNWLVCGLPRVVLGQRLCASFCATRIPSEHAPEIQIPWDTFILDVPPTLLFAPARRGIGELPLCYLGAVLDCEFPAKRWRAICVLGIKECVRFELGSRSYGSLGCMADEAEKLTASKDEMDRFEGCCLRLLLGAIIELQEHRPSRSRALGASDKRNSKRDVPHFFTVRLTRDVKVDCRQAVRDYIRGASDRKLSVQTLVRGHWKMQPHGPKAGERKFIQIEPYWRGPEDAPIALKNHVLGS